jgi:hypothetical protein
MAPRYLDLREGLVIFTAPDSEHEAWSIISVQLTADSGQEKNIFSIRSILLAASCPLQSASLS